MRFIHMIDKDVFLFVKNLENFNFNVCYDRLCAGNLDL